MKSRRWSMKVVYTSAVQRSRWGDARGVSARQRLGLTTCLLVELLLSSAHPLSTATLARVSSPRREGSPPALTSLASVSAGRKHTCGVTRQGAALCWGSGYEGQLGAGVLRLAAEPIQVVGLENGVQAVSSGGFHTCAITSVGGVKCWGLNESGQLGDGTKTDRLAPTDVAGLTSGVIAIQSGYLHSCAITVAGRMKCWGYNGNRELGIGFGPDRTTPVDVVGMSAGVTAMATGLRHTCAIKDGGLKCWGENYYGQLGTGDTFTAMTPVDVVGMSSGVVAVTAGLGHTCALTNSNGAKCWGLNGYGELGDGTKTLRKTPVSVIGIEGAVALKAGESHTCAQMPAGGTRCWGENNYGQLGDGTMTDQIVPVDVVGLGGRVAAITAGEFHTCALSSGGGLKCWGFDRFGQLGDGRMSYAPVAIPGLNDVVTANAAALGQHACAVLRAGSVKCFGYNQYGQLGDGTMTTRTNPMEVYGLGGDVTAVAGGSSHTCALTTAGGVKCWGANAYFQLGIGGYGDRLTPSDVAGLTEGVVALAAGAEHTCALTQSGGVKCWGRGAFGRLGDGTQEHRWTPTSVTGLSSGVVSVSAGGFHTCAVTDVGAVKCWGDNSFGQLGDGTRTNRLVPTAVSGLTNGYVAVAAGYGHSCALETSGSVKCWGDNANGTLGDGTLTSSLIPVGVTGLTNVVSLSASRFHACALTAEGGVACWGANASGQLGGLTDLQSLTPAYVAGLTSGAVAMSAGTRYSCAVTTESTLKCWMIQETGEFSDGAFALRPTPVTLPAFSDDGVVFTDATLIAGLTPIRAVHITELRAFVDVLRSRYGLTTCDWTDPALTAGVTPVRSAHIMELRAALQGIYEAAGRTPPPYSDSQLSGGTMFVRQHIDELRNAILAIY